MYRYILVCVCVYGDRENEGKKRGGVRRKEKEIEGYMLKCSQWKVRFRVIFFFCLSNFFLIYF